MTSKLAPKARKNNLIVKEVSNEVLIYDENNHQALSRAAPSDFDFCRVDHATTNSRAAMDAA